MNRQYPRNAIPRRAGLAQPVRSQVYSDMVDADDYSDDDSMYDDAWQTRTPRSAIRYTEPSASVVVAGNRRYVLHNRLPQAPQQSIPQPRPPSRPQPQVQPRSQPRPQAPPQPQYDEVDEPQPRPRHNRRLHPMFILGCGMAAMLALWILGSAALSWWNVTQDDWHYGRPRTFQTDAVVGHHESPGSPSHFIAMNYKSRIVVIEYPGGDTTHARLYQGPTVYGDGQDLAPATLGFKDINGDGKPDMILVVGATHIAFINDGGQFRLLKPGEVVSQY
jgi:hypothetical protein